VGGGSCELIQDSTSALFKKDLELAEKFVMAEQIRLDVLKEKVSSKKRNAPQKYRKLYAILYNKIDSRRTSIKKMLPPDIMKYKEYYEREPNEDIKEMEKIDSAIKLEINKSDIERRRQAMPSRYPKSGTFMSAEPPIHSMAPKLIPIFQPVNIIRYGYAPNYPAPTFYAQYYVEHSSGRHMQWDPRGFWYYLAPPVPLLPRPDQEPLVPGQRFLQPSYHRGVTRKHRNYNNNTKKNI